MKVKIGPYKNWIGPYQIADTLKLVGVSDDRCHKIGEWLGNTWVNKFYNYIHNKKERVIKVHLDNYDTWGMDSTLAYIILPMLIKLKEEKHGSPIVSDEDVPEHLRSTNAPPKENDWDVDDLVHDRWDWVMSEMIWAFEQVNIDWEDQYYTDHGDNYSKKVGDDMHELVWSRKPIVDRDGIDAHAKRMSNGFILFGKYYQGLWD